MSRVTPDDPAVIVETRPPKIGFVTDQVQPPSRVYCTLDDKLFVTNWSNVATLVATINVRTLRADGSITPSQFTVQTAGARTPVTNTFTLPEGFILSIGVTCPNASNPVAYTYVTVGLFRNNAVASNQYEGLFCGYVSPTLALGYPESPSQRPTDGAGTIRSITGTTPGAGADISETVPANARWELLNFRAQLTTSATVASRQAGFVIDDGANIYHSTDPQNAQTASNVFTYEAAAYGYNPNTLTNRVAWSLMTSVPLQAGYRIRTLTNAIQAGDQWTAPQYLVREWLENI